MRPGTGILGTARLLVGAYIILALGMDMDMGINSKQHVTDYSKHAAASSCGFRSWESGGGLDAMRPGTGILGTARLLVVGTLSRI
jgi:hypothetical protein